MSLKQTEPVDRSRLLADPAGGIGPRRNRPETPNAGDRRAFINAGFRYLLLAGALLLGTLLIRRSLSRTSGCIKPDLCRRCRELIRCDLPPARAARHSRYSL